MPHESFPPSYGTPQGRLLSIVTRLPLAKAAEPPKKPQLRAPTERVVRGGKVVEVPTVGGAVRIVGLSESGEWIAEFACRERDFDERYIRRMAQHVAEATGVHIAVVE